MQRNHVLLLLLAAMPLACGLPGLLPPTSTPQAVQTASPPDAAQPACISPKPAQKDIDRALSFTGDLLDAPEWKRTYAVSENRVAVTWQNSSQGATIYLEALIFPCGYHAADLDQYFSDGNWRTIFLNYQSHELVDECKAGRLRLYEFKAVSQRLNYVIHYWVAGDSETRLISTMIVFPAGSEAALTNYGLRLFPDLPSCF